MSTEKTPHALNAVLARATVDRAFRNALLTAPRRAIFETFGMHIPGDFRIRFIERDADLDALVVLPDYLEPDDDDAALSDVSGGMGPRAHDTWAVVARARRSLEDETTR